MSTRGYLGIQKKEELKGQYNHFDSYIEGGLGQSLVEYLNSIDKERLTNILSETFDYIELVDENTKPTQEQIEYCIKNGLVDINVGDQSLEDWYCLLRLTQGDLEQYVERKCKYMLNGNNFLKDDIFCEYGYVINLDTNKLDIYTFGSLNNSYPLNELNIEKIIKEIEQ